MIDQYGISYQLQFHLIPSDEISKHCKFKHVTIPNDCIIQINLCQQCKIHLTHIDTNEAKKPKHTWPAFFWSLLKDRDLHRSYGNTIWKFTPTIWRHWWLESVCYFFDNITIEEPFSYFVDRSPEIDRWNQLINSHTLPNLRDACNELLVPKILCPFGCSEMNFRCGTVSFDIVLQRYMPKCLLKKWLTNKAGFKFIEYARDDYIRINDDYDEWLLNDEWKIQPSIAFVDGVPQVLTCKDHDKGSKLYHIHTPRQPLHNLPSKYSDQLCHCVMRCRTVKPLQKSIWSQ